MIARMWQGTCSHDNADAYEQVLLTEILPELDQVPECFGAYVLRREDGPAVQFVVLHLFGSFDAVRAFAGEQYEQAAIPEKARRLLSSFDPYAQHFEVRNLPRRYT